MASHSLVGEAHDFPFFHFLQPRGRDPILYGNGGISFLSIFNMGLPLIKEETS